VGTGNQAVAPGLDQNNDQGEDIVMDDADDFNMLDQRESVRDLAAKNKNQQP